MGLEPLNRCSLPAPQGLDWICHTLLNTMLTYYDRNKPVIVQTNASEYGSGATLIQSAQPIAFASRTLTDMETCYASIERECLLVCFGLKKLHTYLYGRHVIVQNDHKPLEMIQHKPIHATPPHLQCIYFCMQKYDYTIQYKSGKEMIFANSLSHSPPPTKSSSPLPSDKKFNMFKCPMTS